MGKIDALTIELVKDYFEEKEQIKKSKRQSKASVIKSRTNELVAQGIDKILAEVMAKSEFESGLIKAVVM